MRILLWIGLGLGSGCRAVSILPALPLDIADRDAEVPVIGVHAQTCILVHASHTVHVFAIDGSPDSKLPRSSVGSSGGLDSNTLNRAIGLECRDVTLEIIHRKRHVAVFAIRGVPGAVSTDAIGGRGHVAGKVRIDRDRPLHTDVPSPLSACPGNVGVDVPGWALILRDGTGSLGVLLLRTLRRRRCTWGGSCRMSIAIRVVGICSLTVAVHFQTEAVARSHAQLSGAHIAITAERHAIDVSRNANMSSGSSIGSSICLYLHTCPLTGRRDSAVWRHINTHRAGESSGVC